jgi:hypothetical protein
MNFLKQGLAVLIIATALFMTACTQEDDDCIPPAVSQNIVGTWALPGGLATVEFQSNGTLIDPSDDLIGGVINNDTLSVKTYSISNDSLFTLAASATTTNSISGSYGITKNECNEITLSAAGVPIVFTRQ